MSYGIYLGEDTTSSRIVHMIHDKRNASFAYGDMHVGMTGLYSQNCFPHAGTSIQSTMVQSQNDMFVVR